MVNLRLIQVTGQGENQNKGFPRNEIITSRYNLFTFLPKSVIELFGNYAYCIFLINPLILAISQSDVNIYWPLIFPFPFLLLIAFIFNAYQDIRNHKNDKKSNNKLYYVWNGHNFAYKASQDINVGDIIWLNNKEYCPADILILTVGEEEHICCIDSTGVTGGKDIKVRKSIKDTQLLFDSIIVDEAAAQIHKLNMKIKVPETEQKNIYGSVKLAANPQLAEITKLNFIPRGSQLTETSWIFGVVLYTGKDSFTSAAISCDYGSLTILEKRLNGWIFWMIALSFLMIISAFFVNRFWFGLDFNDTTGDLLVYLIVILHENIPLSVYIFLPLIRWLQCWKITKNNEEIKFNSKKAIDNLGQIEYILADRSGTITKDKFIVTSCIIEDRIYLRDENLKFLTPDTKSETSPLTKAGPADTVQEINNDLSCDNIFSFKYLKNKLEKKSSENSKAYHFVMCLALCNQVFPYSSGKCISISGDDKILVETSKILGISLISRNKKSCVINAYGNFIEYGVIAYKYSGSKSNKFRIIISDIAQLTMILYVKGSKEPMFDIFSLSQEEKLNIEETLYCNNLIGKRLIFAGYKILSSNDIANFNFKYENAKLSPVNSDGKIENLFEELEKDLTYLGAATIEDKIADDTKDTIDLFKKAGIKFWLMSGENEEITLSTAVSAGLVEINVGIARLTEVNNELEARSVLNDHIKRYIIHYRESSKPSHSNLPSVMSFESQDCNSEPLAPLIKSECSIVSLNDDFYINPTQLKHQIKIHPFLSKFANVNMESPLSMHFNPNSVYFILSVDSSGINYGLSTEENRKYFSALLCAANCVCFHSLSPNDKSRVAKFLKNNFSYKPTFLAIGDGSSDIGMIKQAHIGVGINGKKGKSASNAAQISIRKFSQLQDLLLFEGRIFNIRIINAIFILFFGSLISAFLLFFYTWIENTAGDPLIDLDLMLFHYLICLVIPLLIFGIFDKDFSRVEILKFSEIYSMASYRKLITVKRLIFMIILSLLCASIIFVFNNPLEIINNKGFTENRELSSIQVLLNAYGAVLLYFIPKINSYTRYTILSLLVSVLLMVITLEATSWSSHYPRYGILDILNSAPVAFLQIFFVPLICFVPIYLCRICNPFFLTKLTMILNLFFESKAWIENYIGKLGEIYKESSDFSKKGDINAFNFNRFTLRFKSECAEIGYQTEKSYEVLFSYRVFIVCRFIGILSLMSSLVWYSNYGGKQFKLFSVIYLPIYFIFMVFSWTPFFASRLKLFMMFLNYYEALLLFIGSFVCRIYVVEVMISWPVILFIAACADYFNSLMLSFAVCVAASAISFIEASSPPISENSTLAVFFSGTQYTIILFSIWISSAIVGYKIEMNRREKFILIKKVEAEVEKSKQVLSCILPRFVKNRVKNGVRYIAEDQGIVSVLFCDIYNFDEIVEIYTANELVALLDNIYRQFDHICEIVGVTKVETVGKTYMACAGIKDNETELDVNIASVCHVRRGIEMGMSILKAIKNIKLKNGEHLKVKIGLHSGPVHAGVVGFHKPQFSLVGDTVNTASRMATTNVEINSIQISEDSFNLIEDKNEFSFCLKKVDAKGKGLINVFTVKEKEITDLNRSPPLSPSLYVSSPLRNAISLTLSKSSFMEKQYSMDSKKRSLMIQNFDLLDPSELFERRESDIIEPIKCFSFKCKEGEKEKLFRSQVMENNSICIYCVLIVSSLCNFIMFLVKIGHFISTDESDTGCLYFSVMLFALSILFMSIAVTLKWIYLHWSFPWILQIFYICVTFATINFWILDTNAHEFIKFSYLTFNILLLALGSTLFFKRLIISILAESIPSIIFISFLDTNNKLPYIVVLLSITLITIHINYYKEKNLRIIFAFKDYANRELEKTENLLTQMMPPHVYKNLKEEIAQTDFLKDVTLLYADIVGFTAWSSNRSPESVLDMLYELFCQFDRRCVEFNIYKVHTIGDCYVAMGYKGEEGRNPGEECFNLINFAISMVEIINEFNCQHFTELNMRIGIHTGNIIGGIAGTNIVRYDIYGRDVLIANKMESNGISGKIAVSEATKNLIENYRPGFFKFKLHKEVSIFSIRADIKLFLIDDGDLETSQSASECSLENKHPE
ncbi:unnamed protein product [Blepharisma stoltei]|uniref:Guanylate cyclase domain-containing protein n=1 Tax=Blepharisma stoltei TaxID=1481888 RepID=A0AAU9JFX4_9CILI|nr:unnamed protein product [Blepharisma stoltei]